MTAIYAGARPAVYVYEKATPNWSPPTLRHKLCRPRDRRHSLYMGSAGPAHNRSPSRMAPSYVGRLLRETTPAGCEDTQSVWKARTAGLPPPRPSYGPPPCGRTLPPARKNTHASR